MSLTKKPLMTNRRSLLKGTGAMIAGLSFLPRGAMAADDKTLNIYNYDTYIGDTTLSDFKDASGIDTNMDLFADQDELFAKLKGGNPGYDAIIVSGEYLPRMIDLKMVMELDHSKLPNMVNIDPTFLQPVFDPGRKYSIPYLWGTVGIGYRKSMVGDTVIDSWKYIFDSDKFAGQISVMGEANYAIACAAKYLGFSCNTVKPDELKKIEEMLLKQKKNIKIFAPDNGQELLAQREVAVCQEWNGDIVQVMVDDDDISYAVPNEGACTWEDTWCIPTGAKSVENAYAFINYILDPKVAAAIAEKVQYATPNAEAKKLLPTSYLQNPAIFPPAEVLAKCEPLLYIGEEGLKLRDEMWTKVRAE